MDINVIKPYIKAIMEKIALENHTNKEKQKVREYTDRFSIACPICNDSDKHTHKKRGNLYLKSLRYKCFNCGESETFFSFMKRFNVDVDLDRKMEMVDYIHENMDKIKWNEDDFVINNLNKLIPIEDLANFFNTNEDSPITNFSPVKPGSLVHQYLIERKIYIHDDIYEGSYWHTKKWFDPVLININQAKNKVLGIQVRNLKGRDKRFYKIIPFSDMYEMVYSKELDEIEKIGYNKLSYLYNILKVNWEYPITVFEGFLDTKFFPNSIGCVGTNTDLRFLLNQDIKLRFFYDYDKTGLKKTKEMINNNQSVFLWERFFEDWSKKSKQPTLALLKLQKNVVDLNDVGKIVNNPYKTFDLEKYFSIDAMDLFWIRDLK